MLQARSSEGKLMTLAMLTRMEIEHYRKDKFYCPTCNHPVMIKSGPKTIPHFAHYPQSNCPSSVGGEGPYHLKGKLYLYQWLQKQHLNVRLEKYLKSIQQQPDIYLTIQGKRIAIEYQCSRVNLRDIQKRNTGYLSLGITPIWILGANLFARKATYQLKIDQFILQFAHKFSEMIPLKLYFFCPQTIQLVTFNDLYFTHKNQAIGNLQFHQLNQLTFLDLFRDYLLPKKVLYELWKKEKHKFRLQPQQASYGQTRIWYQWLYLQNTHIEYLPSIIHLPIQSQYMMKSPLWNWQSRICLQVIQSKKVGSLFTIHECLHVIKGHMNDDHHFPLIQSRQHHPIREYLKLLKQLNYIKKVAKGTYRIIKEVQMHKHIDQSLKSDIVVMNELKKGNT